MLSFATAVSPSERFDTQQHQGVTRDSEIIRAQPLSAIRYYPVVHTDAYLYFEIGRQFAGKRLPPATDPVAARLSRTPAGEPLTSVQPRLPYRDFEAVYPPLAVSYFRLLSSLTQTFDQFFALLRLVNLIAVMAMVWLAARTIRAITGTRASQFWPMALLLTAAVGPRYLSYYDAISGVCLTLAIHEGVARRWTTAGMAIAAGTWLKVFAIFLGPLFLIEAWRADRWRATARLLGGFASVSLLAVSPWLLARDGHFLAAFFEQSGRRYFEYGSFFGSTLIILRQLGLAQFEYANQLDSLVVVSPISSAAIKLAVTGMAVAVLLVAALFARSRARVDTQWVLASSLTIVAVLIAAPVYSPQYNVIVFSVLVVGALLAPHLWPLAMVYFIVGQIQHPLVETLTNPERREIGRAVVFAIRNAFLLWMTWKLWKETRAPESARQPTAP